MAIAFKCPSCGQAYSVPEQSAGRKARCKACGNRLVIPGAGPTPAKQAPQGGAAPPTAKPVQKPATTPAGPQGPFRGGGKGKAQAPDERSATEKTFGRVAPAAPGRAGVAAATAVSASADAATEQPLFGPCEFHSLEAPMETVTTKDERKILSLVEGEILQLTGHKATKSLRLNEFTIVFKRKLYMGPVEAVYGGFALAFVMSGLVILALIIWFVHHMLVKPRMWSWAVMAGKRCYLVGCKTARDVTRITSVLEMIRTPGALRAESKGVSDQITTGFTSSNWAEWLGRIAKQRRYVFFAIAESSDLSPKMRKTPRLYALGAPKYMRICLDDRDAGVTAKAFRDFAEGVFIS